MRERASWPARDWEVRAILDGRKTQVRSVVKPQPDAELGGEPYWFIGGYRVWPYREVSDPLRRARRLLACPYGAPGDRLWVRESWAEGWTFMGERQCVFYRATGDGLAHANHVLDRDPFAGATAPESIRWRPSIHMPRWASRITLEVTGVRVERLQGISVEDCRAEGVVPLPGGGMWSAGGFHDGHLHHATLRGAYRRLWESINGPSSWDANPWVWAVEFRRLDLSKPQPGIDTSAGCVEGSKGGGHE